MKIRAITESDAGNFIELLCEIDHSGFMLYEPGERKISVEQQKISIQGILQSTNSMVFVAEIDGKLVGHLSAKGGMAKRNKHVASLSLGVVEEYRRQGIASELLNELLLWVEETELTKLELTVMKHNVKAINLYKKFGFLVEGEINHSLMIDGKPVNEYDMYRLV